MALGLDRLQRALEVGRGRCVRGVDVERVGWRLSVGVRVGLADERKAAVLKVPPPQKLAARHKDAPAPVRTVLLLAWLGLGLGLGLGVGVGVGVGVGLGLALLLAALLRRRGTLGGRRQPHGPHHDRHGHE